MTDHVPINPCTIPQFTGDLDALEKNKAAIDTAAGTFRDAGSNVDSEFQGLSAFYSAPEAEKLFATTKPVKTDSDFFADQLESASKALGEYITEARPIVARLKELQAKATTFSNKISGDKHWKDDGDKIDENNDLIHDVNAAVSAFWAAERTCANKIRALYCAPPLTADDGSHGANMYGYKGEDLNKAQDLPWGSQLEETHRAWEIGYWVKSFVWDGLIVDGIWGTIRGLGTLIGVDGWDKAGQAWTGLAKLATGLTLASIPGVGTAFWMLPDKDLPPWIRDSRTAVKETGKALVAWDEWGKNPARAAGAVTFNVLTTVFTGGAGTAAKAGTVAKVISVAGKAGRLIDPMTYIGKAGQLAKVKVGDLFANFGKVDGAFPKITDVVWKDLPKADMPGVKFPHPEDTVRLPDDALGRPQFYDKTTHQLLDHQGLPKQDLTAVPKGPDHPLAEIPKREDVTVGAPKHQEVTVGGGNTHHVTGTADHPITGGTTHTPGGTVDHTPGGTAGHTPGGTVDHTPHNSHTEPGGNGTTPGHGGTDTTPTGGGHGDTPSTGGGHGDGPSTGGHGDDGPGVPHQGEHGDGGFPNQHDLDTNPGDSLPHGGEGPSSTADGPHADGAGGPHGSDGSENWGTHNGEPVNYALQPDEGAVAKYARIREATEDVPRIAENYGIDPAILERAKSNLFLEKHDVYNGPGPENFKSGVYFTAYDEIAMLWEKAEKGTLKDLEGSFRGLIIHEYVEGRLLEAGAPFTSGHPSAWADTRDWGNGHIGAHDVAPISMRGAPPTARGTLVLWPKMGLEIPEFTLADDLSNLDVLVEAAKKGFKLP
ncbi:hypothetical protein [Streptomyces sp. NPDC096033]|uniref:hypothetical protein n=1 Tax=Streptomyces sp. NPDC096033 TaxID=3366071 RepID=UPI0037FA7CBC